MTREDLTARARLRDAAITVVGRDGVDALTARRVAAEAGVSPGLVAHHFGSMDGLRRACNEHVASVVRRDKEEAIAQGANLDPLAALRSSASADLIAYVARVLTEDSAAVDDLVDRMVLDAEAYIATAEADGHVRPSPDARRRAAVVVLWSLGTLVLHRHTERLLGVDITHPANSDPGALADYATTTYDLLGRGLFTPEFADRLLTRLTKATA